MLAEKRKDGAVELDDSEQYKNIFKYVPHKIQLAFHRSPAKIRAFSGGNRSGKTTAGIRECIWAALGIHPFGKELGLPQPPIRIRACGPSYSVVIEEVILPYFFQILPNELYTYKKDNKIIEFFNGSAIHLLSYDQDLSRYGGSSLHLVWEDEEPPERIHYENLMRTVDTGGKLIMTYTPVHGMSWSYSTIFLRDGDTDETGNPLIQVFVASTYDNPYIARSEIAAIKSLISDPQEVEARLYGRYFSRSGLVFKYFDHSKHVIEPFEIKPEWPIYIGLDWHVRNPQAVVFVTMSPEGKYYVFDEIYQVGLVDEIADEIKARLGDRQPTRCIIDSNAATSDSIVGISPKTMFARQGLHFLAAKKGKGSVLEGIATLNELFRDDLLFIFRNCPSLINQISAYLWAEWSYRSRTVKDPRERPLSKDDHLVDALRFVLTGRPSFRKVIDFHERRRKRPILFKKTGY